MVNRESVSLWRGAVNHPFRRQREIDFNTQRLAVEIINQVERPDTASIKQLVVHKIYRPHFIDGLRYRQRLRRFSHRSLLRLDAQIQLRLVSMARLADAEHRARHANRNAALLHNLLCHLTSMRWLQN